MSFSHYKHVVKSKVKEQQVKLRYTPIAIQLCIIGCIFIGIYIIVDNFIFTNFLYPHLNIYTEPNLERVVDYYLLPGVGLLCAFAGYYFIQVNFASSLVELVQAVIRYQKTGIFTYVPNAVAKHTEIASLGDQLERIYAQHEEFVVKVKTIRQQNIVEGESLKVAMGIQHGMLPDLDSLNAQLQGYKLLGGMHANEAVGGDMYDALLLDADHLLIMIADVSGEGLPAAVFMMITQTIVHSYAEEKDVGVILEQTNDFLSMHNKEMLFVTMWMGIIELSTGHIDYASAGHNPPLLKNGAEESSIWLKQKSGLVLGLRGKRKYKQFACDLQPGAKLLLYTDGLSEAKNEANKLYGDERLEAAFRKAAKPESIIDDILAYRGAAPQSDDMTYLWLERQ